VKPGVPMRVATVRTVGRVMREGAYSNVVIDREAAGMDGRDAATFRRLVYTVLRFLVRIDRTIEVAAGRPAASLDPPVLDVLRVAAAEVLFSATPDHGAVDSAVEAARAVVGPRPVGFVNAVARRIARDGEPELPGGPEGESLRHGVARWLWDRLASTWGEERAGAFLDAANRDAPVGIRTRRPHALDAVPVDGIPGAAYLTSVAGLSGAAAAGDVLVMDPASVAVAVAVGARPGMAVVDLAAAPGSKTVCLWDDMEGAGLLVAADRHPRRLATAVRRLDPIGVHPRWLVMDAVRPALAARSVDRVLLDAPCTGLGTLRRRPEIRHRLTPRSPKAMAKAQRRMLDAALSLVRPGGAVVYSVCTVFPEETVDLVAGYSASPPEGLPGTRWGSGVLLSPDVTATDGMFVSVVRAVG
jgi:16S rRNA (cytosine967-C5)-methyltransferase